MNHTDTSSRTLRVVLVDDHRLLAQSLALALGLEGVSCTVPELTDRDSLLREVLADPPELVLLDLDLGGAIGDGSGLVTAFVEAGCRVLVVSASTDDDQVCRALERGAVGVVRKDVPFTALLETALAATRGEEVMAPVVRRQMLEEARVRRTSRAEALVAFDRLSAREGEVLRWLANGHSVSAIATAWVVSETTVRSQVRAILSKLGVTSQLQAVAAANRLQWLPTSA